MEEDNEGVADSTGIVRPSSAYHHFSRVNSAIVRDELTKEGKDSSLGVVVSVVSAKWKAIGEVEKAKYEKLAKDDRERYNRECELRDEEVLRQQEERRKAHAVGEETETKMRGSTLAVSDASNMKSEVPKKQRIMSEAEKEKIDQRRQLKKDEDNTIKTQLDTLKQERAQQAEARLKYLLSQSDIFSHFGAVKADTTGSNLGAGTGGMKSGSSANNLKGAAAGAGSSRSSKHRGGSAADELDEDERAMAADEDGDDEEQVDNTKGIILNKQPACIVGGTMKPYQIEGLNWMIRLQENGINGILADEMGLGKTLQSISVVAYMHEFRKISGPHLVMVPKSTLSNWCNEFQKWCPVIRVLRFHGNKEERSEIADNLLKPAKNHNEREWDVVVTTYEVVNLEKNVLTKIAWNYLIIDEAHRLKNEESQFATTVRTLNTKYRLLLTGTPLQNNLHELWALLNFLLPDVFASSEQFDDWFNLDVDDNEAKQRMIGQLHKLLRPFMIRRLKIEVEKTLPPKSETILFTGMSTVQKNLYRQVLLRDIDTINGASNTNSNGSRTAILNIVMQLRKCCNHPYLFPGVEDRSLNPMGEHLYENCGKMVLLHKLLRKMKERGHRVLIFSQMTRMIDILEDYLISQEYQYCRIDGNTTYEEREDRIADFNRPNSDKFIFVLSTRAGGLGINLQTADTVILYDSDWNPQADLQAQDRAHRIGQQKPVQVFRLVTDETVEVKVVERAQQKLKLDAMVVQQGRLQDKEKKMSKQDLLDTLRFGADKIFRSKDSTISDADIDLILEEGRKRTEEMTEKLQTAEKGDMYNFKLDGGMSTQVFEGKDYSDKNTRQQELNTLAGLGTFIDPGKRERKAIATYSETIARQAMNDENDKKQKLPRHLKLPKMEDWQFFNKVRLNELQSEEIRLFDQIVERGEAPQTNIGKLIVLPIELHEEKLKLIALGFGDWTRVHFNNFIRGSAKHGRYGYEKIAKDVGRPVDETQRYSIAFWERGANELPSAEWDRVTKQIEKGEKRLEEINRLTTATSKLISMFEDPWEELTFRNVGNPGRILFNAVEDRFLLCLTHLHGYGNWDQIRNSVRRCERFRFDFYLQSCSADVLGKRCETLMRSAERELLEIERKRQISDEVNVNNSRGTKLSGDHLRKRLAEITQQISEESKRLANTRAQLQRIKNANSNTVVGNGTGITVNSISGATSSAGIMKAFLVAGNKSTSDTKKNSESVPGHIGATAMLVPDSALPELCRIIIDAGPDGVTKIVNTFIANHSDVSKRQVEIKIAEIAVKEKRADDKYIVWHLKDEYLKYLKMTAEEATTQAMNNSNKKRKVVDLTEESTSSLSANKKQMQSVDRSVNSNTKNNDTKSNVGLANSSSTKAVTGTESLKEPKRYKRAFGFFVKAMRATAEKQLGSKASETDALKDLLTEMWEKTDPNDRKPYEKKEQEDRQRYERESKAYEEAKGSNKKKKISK